MWKFIKIVLQPDQKSLILVFPSHRVVQSSWRGVLPASKAPPRVYGHLLSGRKSFGFFRSVSSIGDLDMVVSIMADDNKKM